MANANTKLESAISQAACTLIYKYLGVKGLKLNIDKRNGYPDVMFLIPGGKPIFIEFKRKNEKPRALQKHIHAKMRKAGYTVFVCDSSIDAVTCVIEKLESMDLPEKSRETVAKARRTLLKGKDAT